MSQQREDSRPRPGHGEVRELVEHLFRHKAGQMVATLTRLFGVDNLELAEDAVHETLLKALRLWPYRGVPDNPGGWLLQVARNHALDVLRREAGLRRKSQRSEGHPEPAPAADTALALDDPLGDDQLTMMFLCCHPALSREAQVALTLKTVGGFGTPEIARAFLLSEPTVSQRLVRAKRRLREQRLPFALPPPGELPARLDAVLAVLYLLFNEGYNASQGDALVRRELCAEAIRLGTLLAGHPVGDRPKVHALLALMSLHASRLPARLDADGNLLSLAAQERLRWDREAIARGLAHLERAGVGAELSSYHLEAGIAACHAVAASDERTDWEAILFYYDEMAARSASPVVLLNRAVAVAMARGIAAGLQALDEIKDRPELRRYYLLPATLGELYERSGQPDVAVRCYRDALALATNGTEQRFLQGKLARIDASFVLPRTAP